jgi:L-ascorbate metabolism protein UlaG (beta-lactamase superfamily)
MEIVWQGQACFQILTGKNKETTIVIDPFSEKIGLRLPKIRADILLVSHQHFDHNNTKGIEGKPFLIEGPGEYEVKGIGVWGIPAFHDDLRGKERGENTIYLIEAEEVRVCHLGDLGQKELTSEQIEKIGRVDVLMIPVGGVYTINGYDAPKIISQIEPRIVVPMHFKIKGLNIQLEGVEKFLKAMGQEDIQPQPKLVVKPQTLPFETKIILLKAK